MGNVITT